MDDDDLQREIDELVESAESWLDELGRFSIKAEHIDRLNGLCGHRGRHRAPSRSRQRPRGQPGGEDQDESPVPHRNERPRQMTKRFSKTAKPRREPKAELVEWTASIRSTAMRAWPVR